MPAGDLEVFLASPGDIPDLVALMRDFYAESHYSLNDRWAAESFHRLVTNASLGAAWIARSGGKAAGYVVLSVRYAMEFGAPACYIDDLYVRPEYRRRGVATALLDALQRECAARGGASLHVEVGGDNHPAIALYAKFGLVPHTDGRIFLSSPVRPARGIQGDSPVKA